MKKYKYSFSCEGLFTDALRLVAIEYAAGGVQAFMAEGDNKSLTYPNVTVISKCPEIHRSLVAICLTYKEFPYEENTTAKSS